MSGNKGEWSELYVFLKLLSEGRVYAANEKAEKITDLYYPILKIIREETKGEILEYQIDKDDVIIKDNNVFVMKIPRTELDDNANKLLDEINQNSGSFELEEIQKFVNGIKVTKIKAPSLDKSDISMEIEDVHTGYTRNAGFSIKSELGNPPTLLNASAATNFIYKVNGLSSDKIDEINGIETKTKIKDRIKAILNEGATLEYYDMNHDGFSRNLKMIDSKMPEMIGYILMYHYLEDIKTCEDLIEYTAQKDPLDYGEQALYEYKFKKFICSCALGLKPSKRWDGIEEANGGYIIVRADGEVLAYHIYNRNLFEQYLLDNTMFERPSTSRHDYMKLYEENGEIFIKLNIQIRFK
ncbi:MAG: HpaII family restriction endonuclease [Lachnospiraceae bacterium]|nr:HpaII family restriction endonuclease [Lachnospiraceae bacterium]